MELATGLEGNAPSLPWFVVVGRGSSLGRADSATTERRPPVLALLLKAAKIAPHDGIPENRPVASG